MSNKNSFSVILAALCFCTFTICAQTKSVSSAVKKFKAAALTKIKGYNEAYCIAVNQKLRVCKTLTDNEQGVSQNFIIQRAGKTIGQVETVGSSQSFTVLQSDLDANGTTETIVVSHDTTSNGLGIRFYTINIWSELEQKDYQTPLSFSVEEFGDDGTFVKLPGAKEVLIFATSWISSDALDKKAGMYLMGRWFRYHQGKLAPVNKPILVRRLLASFEKDRNQGFTDPPNTFRATTPYSWFANGKGRTVTSDPEISGKESSLAEGIIIAVKTENKKPDESGEEQVVKYQIKTVRSEEVTYIQSYEDDVKDKFPQAEDFLRFGLQNNKILLPENIKPQAIFSELVGLKVQIKSYQSDPDLKPTIVMWIAPAN